MVLYCFAFPLISRRFGVASFPADPPAAPVPPFVVGLVGSDTRRTWLERNSSVETVSATLVSEAEAGAASASREVSRTSVVGTKRTCCWTGVHCDGRGLLKKAARNGFRGCIHSTGVSRRAEGRFLFASTGGVRKRLVVWA